MNRLLTSVALAASLMLACSSSSGGTTGTVSSGTTSASSGTTGASSTTSGAGTTSGAATTSGSAGTTSGSTPYCNGVELQSSAMTDLYVATYPKADELGEFCDKAFDALSDAGVFPAMGGILDNNSYSTQSGLLTFFPAGCDDLGQDAGPTIVGTAITPPTGASTIAAARAGQLDGGTVWGIVTYAASPYYSSSKGKSYDGTLYLEDMPDAGGPLPLSGIAIYIDDQYTDDAGTVGYPDSGLVRGDVVAISGLEWSPYGSADTQDQLAYTANSVVTVLGTQPLPAAVSLSATQIGNGGGAQYVGMRVTQSDTVTNACPTVLQSN